MRLPVSHIVGSYTIADASSKYDNYIKEVNYIINIFL